MRYAMEQEQANFQRANRGGEDQDNVVGKVNNDKRGGK